VGQQRDGDAQRVRAAPVGVDPGGQVSAARRAQVPADEAERVLQRVDVTAPGGPAEQRGEEGVLVRGRCKTRSVNSSRSTASLRRPSSSAGSSGNRAVTRCANTPRLFPS
jgi:hypothetical protein